MPHIEHLFAWNWANYPTDPKMMKFPWLAAFCKMHESGIAEQLKNVFKA